MARLKIGLAVAAILIMCWPAGEVLSDEIRYSAVMKGIMIGPSPTGGRDSVSYEVTVYLNGGAARIEFDHAGIERGTLLVPGRGENAWVINEDEGVAVPVLQAPIVGDLTVDPAQPCADMGMRARCEITKPRLISGVLATGWRYRHARTRGPGGTNAGEFWLDPETGLVLSYRGRTTRRRERRRFEASSVSYPDTLPNTLFELPPELMPAPPEGATGYPGRNRGHSDLN